MVCGYEPPAQLGVHIARVWLGWPTGVTYVLRDLSPYKLPQLQKCCVPYVYKAAAVEAWLGLGSSPDPGPGAGVELGGGDPGGVGDLAGSLKTEGGDQGGAAGQGLSEAL